MVTIPLPNFDQIPVLLRAECSNFKDGEYLSAGWVSQNNAIIVNIDSRNCRRWSGLYEELYDKLEFAYGNGYNKDALVDTLRDFDPDS